MRCMPGSMPNRTPMSNPFESNRGSCTVGMLHSPGRGGLPMLRQTDSSRTDTIGGNRTMHRAGMTPYNRWTGAAKRRYCDAFNQLPRIIP